MIYLDYAATTPMSDEALDVFNQAAKKIYGNPSSLHDIGTKADDALNICRLQLANCMNGQENGVYFTSGGSESNILAIRSLIDGNKEKGKHLITTEVEHSSVYNLFNQLEEEGYEVTYLAVDSSGLISLEQLQQAIRKETILASIHHANSEIGTIQPITKIGQLLHEHHVIFHTDCVQAFGRVPIDVKESYIDSLSVSSHKIYGPKGTGMCYINPAAHWNMQQKNTTHERGFRPGTVDVPSILAFTTAAQNIIREMNHQRKTHVKRRKQFVSKLKELTDVTVIEGDETNQLPHIIGLSFSQAQGQYIMLECNRYGIAISTGTACQVGQQSPSRTMISIGKTVEEAKQFVRISFGKMTTVDELDETIRVLNQIVRGL